jgi:hypothetical protein
MSVALYGGAKCSIIFDPALVLTPDCAKTSLIPSGIPVRGVFELANTAGVSAIVDIAPSTGLYWRARSRKCANMVGAVVSPNSRAVRRERRVC